jgi:heme/copper-type cytochrome/quinol oxidase subunit 4
LHQTEATKIVCHNRNQHSDLSSVFVAVVVLVGFTVVGWCIVVSNDSLTIKAVLVVKKAKIQSRQPGATKIIVAH